MNYSGILTASVADGLGLRTVLYVSGCHHHCKGCFNPETWDPCHGKPYTQKTEDYLVAMTNKPYISGITLLGGEPFYPANIPTLTKLCERIRKECPGKNIWSFTGAEYEDLIPGGKEYSKEAEQLLSLIDVLVAGPFVLAERDVTIAFRGSRNQEIIDLAATRKTGYKVVLDLE